MNQFEQLIQLALAEDLEPNGDLTSNLTISPSLTDTYIVSSRDQPGIMSGLSYASQVYKLIDSEITITELTPSGQPFGVNQSLVKIKGNVQNILKGERLFLNLLQRAISIATHTNNYVQKIQEYPAQILDTRKTTPGLRLLERQAVLDGGGQNHRYNLSDAVLIKDNHIAQYQSVKGLLLDIQNKKSAEIPLYIEVDTLDQLKACMEFNIIDRVLLDNFPPDQIREALVLINGRIPAEASGGINLNNIIEYAMTGVQYISIGSLTLKAPVIDIGLDDL